MLVLTPVSTAWIVIATRQRHDEEYAWVEEVDAPYTLREAIALAEAGTLVKALRYSGDLVEVVVKHAERPQVILSAAKVTKPRYPRNRKRKARDLPVAA
jgi:hypothetical protein